MKTFANNLGPANSVHCKLLIAALAVALFAVPAVAVERQLLTGHVLTNAATTLPTARPLATQQISLIIGLPLRNREEVTNLLEQIYDPASANFHQYLTSGQFAERFGPTETDYQALIDFAKANGLIVTGTHPNRTLLDVVGSVAAVEKAFHTTLGLYQHPTEARMYYAPNVEPSMDLATPIQHISGLDNYFTAKPSVRGYPIQPAGKGRPAQPNLGSGPGGEYWANDFRTAYVPGTTLNGAGQIVGLYELEGYLASDIALYKSQANVANVPVQNVAVDGFSFIPNNGDVNGVLEVCLDIEVAIAMAPGLSQVLVYGATNGAGFGNDILNRMATDNLAKQLSSSWGINVDANTESIFQQFAAQGQSFFMAAGDSDAYVGAIGFGYDDPYITVVGGTTLTTGPGGAWVSEVVWNNNNSGSGAANTGSSGGISTTYAIPSWQRTVSMANNQGSTTRRNIPDVTMVGDNVYTVARGGIGYYTQGTSIAAPLWAALTALVNQQAGAIGRPPVGFLNPALYAVGQGPNAGAVLHDITVGNDTNSVSPNLYFAVPGYDLCSGLGSPNGTNLINSLALFGGILWVDFNYFGPFQFGTFDFPYKTLAGGSGVLQSGGTMAIKAGHSTEILTISKPMTIISSGGVATIGQ